MAATFCMATRANGGLHLGWIVCRWGHRWEENQHFIPVLERKQLTGLWMVGWPRSVVRGRCWLGCDAAAKSCRRWTFTLNWHQKG